MLEVLVVLLFSRDSLGHPPDEGTYLGQVLLRPELPVTMSMGTLL